MTRICVTGGPRTGKTTLADKLALGTHEQECAVWVHDDCSCPVLRHTDDLIGKLDWSAASAEVATWFDAPGPWIIEGVSVSRALRKWREAHPGERPPVDRVIYLAEPLEQPSKGQTAMAKDVATVHAEIEAWLLEHGIRTEFMVHRELRSEHRGYNGMAKL